jgi:YidC/Oxa1 family membrane protein insertase
MQEGMEGNPTAKTMKNFSRVLALLTVPFTATFPKVYKSYYLYSLHLEGTLTVEN